MSEKLHWHNHVKKDYEQIWEDMSKVKTPKLLELFAERLGVDVITLQMLECTWSREHWAWAFPMRKDDGVCGVRLLCENGQMFVMQGSEYGSFSVQGNIDDDCVKVIRLINYKI